MTFDSSHLSKNIVLYLRNMHEVKSDGFVLQTAYLIHVLLFNINN